MILIRKVKMRPSAGEDITGVSRLTTECDNLQNVSERTELIFGLLK